MTRLLAISPGLVLFALACVFGQGCRPSRERIAAEAVAASNLAWDAVVEQQLGPAIRALEGRGWISIIDDSSGQCRRYGPGLYLEGQAYDATWFLNGHLGSILREQDRQLATRLQQALLARQHPVTGSWPWSDDGCNHELLAAGMFMLGEHESAARAASWGGEWARKERLSPEGWLIETESRFVLKSWSVAQEEPLLFDGGHPPGAFQAGRFAWDEMPLLLWILAITGEDKNYPDVVAQLRRGLLTLLDNPGVDERNSLDFLRTYTIVYAAALAQQGVLPMDPYYVKAKEWIAFLSEHEAEAMTHELVTTSLLLSGMAITGLVSEMPETADSIAVSLMAAQDASGWWTMDRIVLYNPTAVELFIPLSGGGSTPPFGGLTGQMVGEVDSVTMLSVIQGLMNYASAVRGEEPEFYVNFRQ